MAGTYSKYDGQAYQTLSSRLVLSNDGTQSYTFTNNSVYTDLLDNESKLISSNVLRNAILSIWDTNAFKETSLTGSSIYYIGVDSGDNLIKSMLIAPVLTPTLLNAISGCSVFFTNLK